MKATTVARRLARWTTAASLLLAALGAQAADYVFPGKLPSGCSGSDGNYTCGDLRLDYGDTITIAKPLPARITVKGRLDTDNAKINANGAAADLIIVVTGRLTPGYAAEIIANVEAAEVRGDAAGSVTWGGSIVSTSGQIAFGYADTVAGDVTSAGNVSDKDGAVRIGGSISTTTGSISLGYGTEVAGSIRSSSSGVIRLAGKMVVGGDVQSASGAIDIGEGTEVAGSVSSSGTITIQQSAVVSGSVSGAGGAVAIGYAASVTGTVSTTTGAISIGGTAKLSSCVRSTGSAKITLDWDANVHSVCCGSTCGNACVANNSGKAMPAACAPLALAHWRMDEPAWKGTAGEVRDSSGNGYHATAKTASAGSAVPSAVTGTPAFTSGTQSTCNHGQFASSGGVTRTHAFVEATGVPALNSSFTVAAWMRPTGGGRVAVRDDVDDGWALSFGDAGANRMRFFNRRIRPSGAVTGSGTNNGCGTVFCLDSLAVVPWNQWSFVAAAVDTAARRVTVSLFTRSGTLLGSLSSAYTGTWGDGSGLLGIGGETAASAEGRAGNGMKGQIDEVQIYPSALSRAMLETALQTTRPCTGASGPDHYELSVPSASLSCQASTVTVTACADASSPCTNRFTGAAGATATLATSAGSLATTTLTFDASGVATTTLSHAAAAQGASVSVSLSNESLPGTNARQCCPDGVACAAGNSCSTSFSTAGFIIASSNNGAATTVPTQTAGTASAGLVLRAVRTNTSTGACTAALTGATTVNWALQCNNPTTCSSGNAMTVTGSSATLVASNPATGVTATTPVAMTFDANGNAPFSFNFADVGLVTLHVSKAAGGTLLSSLAGASNAFVVRPAGFALSGIQQTASPSRVNPAAASAAGARFIAAGESFTASVTARTSTGATARNFGRETVPAGVLLTPTLVLPSGGAAGSLSNATVAGGSFSNGVATVSTLAYSEVGIITLTPSVAGGSYLGAGPVSGTASGNIGRFTPARFALSGTSLAHRVALSCTPAAGFTYLDENFRLSFTLTALNSAGATTQNYTGAFSKLDPASAAAWNLAGVAAGTVFSGASGRLALGSAAGTWGAGVASGVTLTAAALRAATADGPFSAGFGIAPVDSDGVALAAYDLDTDSAAAGNDRALVATVALRHGRLRLGNAVGAADRALALPVNAQFWNGSAYADNTLDSCTTVPLSAMNFGNLRGTISAADARATGAVTLNSGVGRLNLGAPLGGRSGTYDIALSLGTSATDASCLQPWTPASGRSATAGANLAYLRGAWCGSTGSQDPAARVTFGRQRGNDALVYRREMY